MWPWLLPANSARALPRVVYQTIRSDGFCLQGKKRTAMHPCNKRHVTDQSVYSTAEHFPTSTSQWKCQTSFLESHSQRVFGRRQRFNHSLYHLQHWIKVTMIFITCSHDFNVLYISYSTAQSVSLKDDSFFEEDFEILHGLLQVSWDKIPAYPLNCDRCTCIHLESS